MLGWLYPLLLLDCRWCALEKMVMWSFISFQYFTEWAYHGVSSVVGSRRQPFVHKLSHRLLSWMGLWVDYFCLYFPCDVVDRAGRPSMFIHHEFLRCVLSAVFLDGWTVVVGKILLVDVDCDGGVENVSIYWFRGFLSDDLICSRVKSLR